MIGTLDNMADPGTREQIILPWISTLARLILGGSLLVAGLMKVGDFPRQVLSVQAYQFPISDQLVQVIAYAQPIVEILVGLLILAGVLTRWTALIGGFAMLVFIAGIISAWARGLSIDCGCFGPGGVLAPGQQTAYTQDLLRDALFLICGVWLVIFPKSKLAVDTWIAKEPLNGETEQPLDEND